MRILVIGASGFLGHHVCRELVGARHEVAALVRRAGSAPADTIEVAGDIAGDVDELSRTLNRAGPECVIHLAAEIASQRDPDRIRAVNVEGTRALLAACQAAGSPKLVFASTVVTGDAHGAVLDERSTLPIETTTASRSRRARRCFATHQCRAW